jgi:pyruvate,water dikinase
LAGALTSADEEDLLRRVQRAFRVYRSGIAHLAEEWLSLEDFEAIRQRMIGVGSIGGKALGMLVARAILRRKAPELHARLEVHDSFFVGAEVFVTFMVRNGIWWIRENQKRDEGFLQGLEEGRALILGGQFPPDIVLQFEGMLDYFGERPCIVRSSSILEDAHGNAFSGKYESVFLANRGSREERLHALLQAVRTVYASVLDEEALRYRQARGLLLSEERMSLLIMRVSGRRRGQYFFPQAAGVGLSYNPWCWSPDIDPEDGITRLVFGLGTRAVDRPDADYTRLVCLSAPLRRPEVSVEEQHDHSQRGMDLLDLEAGEVTARPIEEIAALCGDFPWRHFLDRGRDGMPWATFQGLLKNTGFVEDLRLMMRLLAETYASPVDIEFTVNFLDEENYRIHLLQCRTFQVQKHEATPGQTEREPSGRAVLLSRGAVIGLGRNVPVQDVIYVPTAAYAALSEQERYGVARLVESLTSKQPADRNVILIGPGRWGTGSPSLGIPVRAGRIARACAICEVVAMHGGLVPDVSLGTHFFNDLVEHDLLYLACFPEKEGNLLDEAWLDKLPSRTPAGKLAHCVRWLDLACCGATLWASPLEQRAGLYVE